MFETGIMGFGVVGKAVNHTISMKFKTYCYDKYLDIGKISDLLKSEVLFVCVPTPFNFNDKEVELRHVRNCLTELDKVGYKGIIVIKSTMPLNSMTQLQELYNELKLVYNPEFLRESTTPDEDFLNQKEVVIGTDSVEIFSYLKDYFSKFLSQEANYHHMTFNEAEMVKLSQNTTLASRVAISNVIYDFCEEIGVDYSRIRKVAFDSFPILGPSMVLVPGPDGKRGFGGKCLPKDTYAFNTFLPNKILDEILKYNQTLRDDLNQVLENYGKD